MELLGEKGWCKDEPRCIVWDWPAGAKGAIEAFETLVERVEHAARAGDDRLPLNQVIALVDSIRPAGLNAVEEGGNWDNLIAMLILTFPEIRWVFGVVRGENKDSRWNRTIAPHHDLTHLPP